MTESRELPEARRGGPGGLHVGELKLRRLLAGESLGAEHDSVISHAATCPECARRIEGITAEQRGFEQNISFDRFAAGVERAARVPSLQARRSWWARPASTRSFLTVMSFGSVAALVALLVGVRPLFEAARMRAGAAAGAAADAANRIKGAASAEVTVRVAPPENGHQRIAAPDAPEPLSVGERIRVGVKPGPHRYLFAISIDDNGALTPLYPEDGTSVELPRSGALQYLPDSLELTGRGFERLIVLLTDEPLELDTVRAAAASAFAKADRNLLRLPSLAIRGEQFQRTFLKP